MNSLDKVDKIASPTNKNKCDFMISRLKRKVIFGGFVAVVVVFGKDLVNVWSFVNSDVWKKVTVPSTNLVSPIRSISR
jgi:hypothetical protein